MVWVAAASLHEQAKAPFQRRTLLAEIRRLFPEANQATTVSYVDNQTNVSGGGSPYSFAYLFRTGSGTYRLTAPGDPNPLGKPRWPERSLVPGQYLDLWQRWSDWQQEQEPTNLTALQQCLEHHLLSLLPPPVEVKRNGQIIQLERDAEIMARIEPDLFWMRTVRTHWDCQDPILMLDRELSIRLVDDSDRSPESAALAVVAVVLSVFGSRFSSYERCSDCGDLFPPERMSGTWCHGCASGNHQVVY